MGIHALWLLLRAGEGPDRALTNCAKPAIGHRRGAGACFTLTVDCSRLSDVPRQSDDGDRRQQKEWQYRRGSLTTPAACAYTLHVAGVINGRVGSRCVLTRSAKHDG